MICLKNRTFAVSQTTVTLQRARAVSCDLLEKSYFCSITNNRRVRLLASSYVVICLKNRTFAVSQTTLVSDIFANGRLWFAWKIVLLQYHKQLRNIVGRVGISCDLLEKSYFCSITNNRVPQDYQKGGVVICLKNRTFAVSQTTEFGNEAYAKMLWFAWKIVLLQYHKQPPSLYQAIKAGCDLLEKSYFCSITNNCLGWEYTISRVVICLKNRTFAVSQTT